MTSEILNAPWSRVALVSITVVAIVCSPMLFIDEFCPAFFATTDTIKLLLIAVATAAPILCINAIAMVYFSGVSHINTEMAERIVGGVAAVSSILSMPPFYVAVIFHSLFHLGGVRTGIATVVIVEIPIALYVGFVSWWCSPLSETELKAARERSKTVGIADSSPRRSV